MAGVIAARAAINARHAREKLLLRTQALTDKRLDSEQRQELVASLGSSHSTNFLSGLISSNPDDGTNVGHEVDEALPPSKRPFHMSRWHFQALVKHFEGRDFDSNWLDAYFGASKLRVEPEPSDTGVSEKIESEEVLPADEGTTNLMRLNEFVFVNQVRCIQG